jgi:hypothetical protein
LQRDELISSSRITASDRCTLTFETAARPEGPAWLRIYFEKVAAAAAGAACRAQEATLVGTYFFDARVHGSNARHARLRVPLLLTQILKPRVHGRLSPTTQAYTYSTPMQPAEGQAEK